MTENVSKLMTADPGSSENTEKGKCQKINKQVASLIISIPTCIIFKKLKKTNYGIIIFSHYSFLYSLKVYFLLDMMEVLMLITVKKVSYWSFLRIIVLILEMLTEVFLTESQIMYLIFSFE